MSTQRPSDWHATVLLCDAAQVADGKLYVLGGGWTLCGPGAFVHALAIRLSVPWDQANRRHRLELVMVGEDSDEPVTLGDPPEPLTFESQFEVGRPPGLPAGSPLDVPFAVGFGPLLLPAASGFAWSVRVDSTEVDRVTFRTRPAL
jgi:hypothetical protein